MSGVLCVIWLRVVWWWVADTLDTPRVVGCSGSLDQRAGACRAFECSAGRRPVGASLGAAHTSLMQRRVPTLALVAALALLGGLGGVVVSAQSPSPP